MRTPPIRRRILVALAACATTGTLAAPADAQRIKLAELADLDLEQLSRITVTSASRREERILDAPASIYVITAEDIRRSGATSLPEALRLAPNLQSIRGDSSQYLLNARGGLAGTANKMLVLIDGRTVYTPLFSGVFWDAQVVSLPDVERIEVISGPGSTLWGTNAVNGVINVITRPASRAPAAHVVASAGNEERGANAIIAGPVGGGHYRAYVRYFDRDDHEIASGTSALDSAERWQAGFRTDWETARRTATVQGDVYSGDIGNIGGLREVSGANLLGRWTTRGDASRLMVQAYLDRTERMHTGTFEETRDTFDVEAQHSIDVSPVQQVVWGGGYRASRDRTANTPALGFMPPERTLKMATLFVQDQVALGERLRATLGLRAERNDYTGVEWLPNARLAWSVTRDQMLWTALTRTVREPSRLDRDLVVPGMPPFLIVPNDTFQSEVANVVEAGYRGKLAEGVTVSVTAFHHEYRKLRTLEPGADGLVIGNGARGRRTGIEAWGDVAMTPDWRLNWGFVAMRHRFGLEPGRVDLGGGGNGNDPRFTATLRSLWNVTRRHEVDFVVRHVGELPNPLVPSYTVVDSRLGWRVTPTLELALRVENLFDKRHQEFAPLAQTAVLERTYLLQATWSP